MIVDNLRYVNPFKKKIGYIGWLGHGNLGDDAMFYAFQKLFSKFDVLPFKYTEKIKKFEKITNRKIFDAVCLGGGTLIDYSTDYFSELKYAQEGRYLTFTWGTGVRNGVFWNAGNRGKSSIDEWCALLKKSSFTGVRGPLSQEILQKNNCENSEIIGDPALALANPRFIQKKQAKTMGINIGITNGQMWGNEQLVSDFIVKFTEKMLSSGWKITFLPVCKKDVPYIEDVVKKISHGVSIFYDFTSLMKTMNFFESCDLFVGEKLHSVILAFCNYTPSIMLEYRPKCLDFMLSMDMGKYNIRTDNLDLDLIMDLSLQLYKNSEFMQRNIYEKVNFYKELQRKRADFLTNMILKDDLCQK